MKTTDLVLIRQVCEHHQIELKFIHSLHELGLLKVVLFEDCEYLPRKQLKAVEKMIHFYLELNINLEGIDAILHLMKRIENLERELVKAKNMIGNVHNV